jgi:DNA-binding response OmpR family regulator
MPADILIAEDDPNILLSLRYLLERAGHGVRTATDGEAALAAVRQQLPDLLLLDVMMPKLDGYQVCRAIRADPAVASVTVVLLTAKSREQERALGAAAGADDYIVKPFSTREVVRRVAELLAGAGHRADAPQD